MPTKLIPVGVSNLGWVADFALVKAIADEITNKGIEISLEGVDDVIKVLQARGYVKIERRK